MKKRRKSRAHRLRVCYSDIIVKRIVVPVQCEGENLRRINYELDGNLQNAIAYIEENLTEEIKVRDVAEKAYVSEFHFQRIFSALCGVKCR